MGMLAINLFSEDVDSLDHPSVIEYRELLQNSANAYRCRMTSFAIQKGVVFFSFDSEELMEDLMADMKEMTGVEPHVCEDKEEFIRKGRELL